MLDLQILLLTVAAVEKATSDDQWMRCNGSEYKAFSGSLMSFIQAELWCHKENASLAAIHSQEENEFVLKLIPAIGNDNFLYDAWIGLYRVAGLLEWYWTDDSEVDYTNWTSGEPSDQYTKYCAFMYARDKGKNAGKWAAHLCHEQLWYYVCMRPAVNGSQDHCRQK